MSHYPEPGIIITNEVKVVLDLSNYVSKKIDHVTSLDTSNFSH